MSNGLCITTEGILEKEQKNQRPKMIILNLYMIDLVKSYIRSNATNPVYELNIFFCCELKIKFAQNEYFNL